MSVQNLEEFFHTQLVKHGVNYNLAARAAKILASGKPDELLTAEEKHLATEVCQHWSKQRQRLQRLNSHL
ncbi:hypothetical protein NIES4072_16620 [Nostoc commune NIES-4072]|uniref:Uncharacterized protein n=1 Tax=Nostoc commune NIES-4072 TaxID=2005467 RepID=A0A2R5FHA3_NOSCO|nr:hypothetical protein [Nostoc commune]BBD64674.1 hypothetical protein NIES4070_10190 [Nostoc commune HK-02]GBG18000.1 hypothetical protein NIES4072_16620 [Nostoc commune NIES-4072]